MKLYVKSVVLTEPIEQTKKKETVNSFEVKPSCIRERAEKP